MTTKRMIRIAILGMSIYSIVGCGLLGQPEDEGSDEDCATGEPVVTGAFFERKLKRAQEERQLRLGRLAHQVRLDLERDLPHAGASALLLLELRILEGHRRSA